MKTNGDQLLKKRAEEEWTLGSARGDGRDLALLFLVFVFTIMWAWLDSSLPNINVRMHENGIARQGVHTWLVE